MFEVTFTDRDGMPVARYRCLLCSEELKTALDCFNHFHDKHKGYKPIFEEDVVLERVERRERKRGRQETIVKFLA